MSGIKAGDCFILKDSSKELEKFIQSTNGTVITNEMLIKAISKIQEPKGYNRS